MAFDKYSNLMDISEICVFEYNLFSFEALLIEKELLIANRHLVGTGLEENLGDTSIYTAGLQTATTK